MKKTLLTAATLLFSWASFSQEINRCMSHEAILYQESLTPGFKQHVDKVFNSAKALGMKDDARSNHLYTIPVVVHIVYNTSAQDLPDSVIYDQMRILNEDYNRQNADTVNMRSDFDIVKGNPKIEFVLAQIDPQGNPTNGITRTFTQNPTFGSLAVVSGDFSDLEKVKSTVDGGMDPWDQSRYLNIWVCNMSVNFFGTEITALLGYATPPAGLSNWPAGSVTGMGDGVVLQFQTVGSNNPNVLDPGSGPIDVRGRTATHEVGHYLGLRHIWGDGDCTAQDGIDDTPNADSQSSSDCDINKNTCTDNIQTIDLPDMVENYMDYSAETCQNSFTAGQVSLMHGVLENERYDLVYNNPAAIKEINTFSVGIYPNPASESITLSSDRPLQSLRLIAITGTEVIDLDPQTRNIDVTELNSGIYILEVSDENNFQNKQRIVIQ